MKPRIVSLCPSNTEVICALGLGDCLVGVDNYSDYPVDIVNPLPRLGPDLHIDVGAVKELKPHLVLTSLSVPGMERVVEAVSQAGLPHLTLSPHTLEDIFHDMERVAEAVNRTALSFAGDTKRLDGLQDTISKLRARVQRIQERTQHLHADEIPKLYFEWWPNPYFSPASGNWLTEVSRLAGGVNVFEANEGQQVRDEDGSMVLEGKPDYFLAVWTGISQHKVPLQKIINRAGWTDLPAMQQGRVFILSEGLFCRPSPRLVDGLEQLVGLLHPDIAEELSLLPPSAYGPIRLVDGTWLDGVKPQSSKS